MGFPHFHSCCVVQALNRPRRIGPLYEPKRVPLPQCLRGIFAALFITSSCEAIAARHQRSMNSRPYVVPTVSGLALESGAPAGSVSALSHPSSTVSPSASCRPLGGGSAPCSASALGGSARRPYCDHRENVGDCLGFVRARAAYASESWTANAIRSVVL